MSKKKHEKRKKAKKRWKRKTQLKQHQGYIMETIRTVADLRVVMHRNERPIYFISATNFNLIGIDEWVRNFKFVSYIDCFDGRHPNVFVPSEIPHAEFESIEDINNYLLQHKEVIDYIHKRGGRAVATFLMFDEKTEEICNDLGIETVSYTHL